MSDKVRLKVLIDDRPVFEADVYEASINQQRNLEQFRSNPAMFAALAGASPEELTQLPGEQVAWMSHGSDIERSPTNYASPARTAS